MTYGTIPFTDEFDPAINPTTDFCKRYRASVVQTKQEMVEMQKGNVSLAFKSLIDASAIYHKRHPVVDIKMSNHNLEVLVKDINEFTEMQQYFRRNPDAMNDYLKYRTWQAISR